MGKEPEYMRRLLLALGSWPADLGPLPEITHATIAHDKWCSMFKGKPCNCDPEINLPCAGGRVVSIDRDGEVRTIGAVS